jgi:hypothetical protein
MQGGNSESTERRRGLELGIGPIFILMFYYYGEGTCP